MSYRGWLSLVSAVSLFGCMRRDEDEDALANDDLLDSYGSEDVGGESGDTGWDEGCWDGGCDWETGGWETGAEEPPIEDTRPLVIADPPPPPITGGGIVVLADGSTAVVSDPERDLVHVVDVVGKVELGAIALAAGAQPWRAVEDTDGMVHVVLRGSGSVATIDPLARAITVEREVCSTPRGIALAPAGDGTLVACAGGELWHLPIGDAAGEVFATLEPDLRDVLVDSDGRIRVTRFRSAEVLTLDAAGSIVERGGAAPWTLTGTQSGAPAMDSNSAWRTLDVGDGGWLMVHQGSRKSAVDVDAAIPWGGIGPCESIVQSTATLLMSDGTMIGAGALDTVALPVDVAVDAGTGRVAIAVGASCTLECDTPDVVVLDSTDFTAVALRSCQTPITLDVGDVDAHMIAVAFTPSGDLLVQQRDPAVLHIFDPEWISSTPVALEGASIEDTGHRLFHEVGRAGLACASCHPEGGDDGHVWTLGLDVRHTPALFSGLAGTAPFHWAGELANFPALVADVHLDRMGMMIEPPEHTAAFETWVTALRTASPRAADDPAALAGRDVFVDLRCDLCHAGEATTNNATIALSEGALPVQIPPLHGVALHPPYFHDGHAATLADAVAEMLGACVPPASPSEDEIADLIAYLESL